MMRSYGKIDITFKMIRFLKTHYMVTSLDIAEHFNISRREVFRYLREFRRNNVIVAHRGRYGYIELINEYK